MYKEIWGATGDMPIGTECKYHMFEAVPQYHVSTGHCMVCNRNLHMPDPYDRSWYKGCGHFVMCTECYDYYKEYMNEPHWTARGPVVVSIRPLVGSLLQ